MLLEKFIQGWQNRRVCRLAAVGADSTVSRRKAGKLAAVGVTVGLVASMGIGALTQSPSIEDFFADSETVTEADLSAAVVEGSAANDRDMAVKVLMGYGLSKDEARAYADSMFENAEKASASSSPSSRGAGEASDVAISSDNKGLGGAAGLSKSASLSKNSLPALSPVLPKATSGDGNSIDSVTAFWLVGDDANTVAANANCATDELLCLKPGGDSVRDLKVQLEYSLSGEYNYAPGELRITVPAYLYNTRVDNTSSEIGGKQSGSLVVPYPQAPKKSQDFNWERIGDKYVITNTRTLSAATKGYIQFALVGAPAAHSIVDMSLHDWQATVEVITKSGNTLSRPSNKLQAQVNTYHQIGSVKKGISSIRSSVSVVPASSLAGKVPDGVTLDENEKYRVVSWYIQVEHSGNQPFILDLNDWLDSNDNPYQGFILNMKEVEASSGGLSLEKKNIFKGWTTNRTLSFTVQTAYPNSQFSCGPLDRHELNNNARITLTPLDGKDSSDSRTATGTYEFSCYSAPPPPPTTPPPPPPPTPSTYAPINSSYDVWKSSNEYKTALNDLRDGKDVEIRYGVHVEGVLFDWLRDAGDNPYVLSNYENKAPLTFTMTDTGATMLNESNVRPGIDWEFISVSVSKPTVQKAYSENLDENGSLTEPYEVVGRIYAGSDNDPSHIPTIHLEAKVGTSWHKVADVDYSSGSCQVTYDPNSGVTGGSPTDCAHVKLPANTTQFRTTVTTNAVGIYYSATPTVKLKATEAMQEMAAKSFTNSNDSKNYAPRRVMRNSAELVFSRQSGAVIGKDYGAADDILKGFTTDSEVFSSKSVSSSSRYSVNYDEGYVTLHYSAQVREDTFIPYGDLWQLAVDRGMYKPLTSGVWYDLLPKGMYPVRDSVRIDGGGSASLRTINNYKGTGRVLMIVWVEGRTPDLSKYYRTNMSSYYVRDVTSISFNARYDFDSIVDYGTSDLHNVIAFEAGKDKFGTIAPNMGEPDNPRAGNNVQTEKAFATGEKGQTERDAMTDLNSSHDNPVFVYAGVTSSVDILGAANTSLRKDVMVNGDGMWQAGTQDEVADVYEGGSYSYRLRMMSDARTNTKDMILFDSLETFQPVSTEENPEPDANNGSWKGTFTGIDVSQMVEKGANPVVYYSTVENLKLDLESGGADSSIPNPATTNVSDRSIWRNLETDPPAKLSDVTAIAVDLRKDANGEDFVLPPLETVSAIIYMKAPPAGDDKTAQFIEGNMHAFNNAFLSAISADATTGVGADSPKFIRKDYTKVGLKEFSVDVAKRWEDDNDRDGKRPDNITVHLLANGVDTGESLILNEDNGWKGTFRHVAYADDNGVPITYTATDEVDGYTTRSMMTGEQSAIVINTHEPERISLQGVKTWVNTEEAPMPEAITLALYADGKKVQTKTVRPDEDGNWSYEFTNLYKYRDHGIPIVYTLGEEGAGEGWRLTSDPNNPMNLTNDWHPYGDVVLSKTIEGATNTTNELDFSFRMSLLNSEGYPLPDEYEFEKSDGSTGTIQHNDVITLKDAQSLRIKELPMGAQVSAEEEDRAGFTVEGGPLKKVKVVANKDNALAFTNVYKTSGRINLKASKTLNGQELRYGQFGFEVYEGTPDNLGNRVRSSGNAADGTVTFGALSYTNVDDGKTYTYTVKEKNTGQGGVTYSEAIYMAHVTVTDNGDGTMSTSVTYEPVNDIAQLKEGKPNFVNDYHATGELALKAWKDLKGRALQDGEFSFELLNAEGQLLQTKTNDAYGAIAFDALPQFDQDDVGQKFLYVIREVKGDNPDPTVKYDESVLGYEAEVVDRRDGTLSFNLTQVNVKQQGDGWVSDGAVASDKIFENELQPGKLTVEKHTSNNSNDQEFRFKVKLTGPDIKDDTNYEYDVETIDSLPNTASASTSSANDVSANSAGAPNSVLASTTSSSRGSNSIADEAQRGTEPRGSSSVPVIAREDKVRPKQSLEGTDTKQSFFASLRSALFAKLSTTRSGVSEQARLLETVATTWSQGAKRPNTLNIKRATGDIVKSGTWGGAPYDLYSDGTLKFADNSTITNPSYTEFRTEYCDGDEYDHYCEYYFEDYITKIEGDHITLVGDASNMFDDWIDLEDISALATWDTSGVTDMSDMFFGCSSLGDLSPLADWDTGSVTDMRSMFRGCWSLGDVSPLADWDTSSVATMEAMFSGCISLTDITALANWDTSNVTSMGGITDGMFHNCRSLSDLSPLKDWDTSSVTNMYGMFRGCTSLSDVSPLKDWDTSRVTNMTNMFSGCTSLSDLSPLKDWDTSRVTTMSGMFSGWTSLSDVSPLKDWDTSRVTTMSSMFYGCTSLTNLSGLENWDTSSLRGSGLGAMFQGCTSLTDITALANWDTSRMTNIRTMFDGCTNIENVDVSGWDLSAALTVSYDYDEEYDEYIEYRNSYGPIISAQNLKRVVVGPESYIILRFPSNYKFKWKNLAFEDGALQDPWRMAGFIMNYGNVEGEWLRVQEYTINFEPGIKPVPECQEPDDPANIPAHCTPSGSKAPVERSDDGTVEYLVPSNNEFHLPGYEFVGWDWNGKEFTCQKDDEGHVNCGKIVEGIAYSSDGTQIGEVYSGDTLTLTALWAKSTPSTTVTDGEFEFTLRGGERATFKDIPAGTAYEVYEYTQKGWVLVQSSGTSGEIKPLETSKASFTNTPIENVASVQVEASKLFDGAGADAGAFDFTLTDANDSSNTQTVSNSAGGAVQFKQILIYDDSDATGMTEEQALARIPADLQANAFAIYPASALPSLTLREKKPDSPDPSIDYDERIINVTISNPFELEDGQSAVAYSYEGQPVSPVFENKTKPGTLSVSKETVNAPASSNAEFTMRVALTDAKGIPLSAEVLADVSATNGENPVQLNWSATGAVTVKLHGSETITFDNVPAGTKYTVEEIDIPRGWTLTGTEGEKTGTITANGTSSVTISNTYSASGTVTLEAYKSLAGRELLEDEFTFDLFEGENPAEDATPLATVTNLSPDIRPMIPDPADTTGTNWIANPHKNQALVTFDDIEITSAGTHKYTIRERAGSDGTVKYDGRSIVATVVATDPDGDGTLTCYVTYEGAGGTEHNLFENTLNTHDIKVRKVIASDSDAVPADYEEALFLMRVKLSGNTNWSSMNYPIVYSEGVETGDVQWRPSVWETTTTSEDVTTTHDEIVIGLHANETFTIKGLYEGTEYSVEEIGWALNGAENKLGEAFSYVRGNVSGAVVAPRSGEIEIPADVTITNRYDKDTPPPPPPPPTPLSLDTSIALEAQKTVSVPGSTDPYDLKDGEFEFVLLDEEGEVIGTASNDASGAVKFDAINYTEKDAGSTFTYRIGEVSPPDIPDAWTYDKHIETVEVTVNIDDDTGELVATADYDSDGTAGAEFTNTYDPVGYLALRADKEVTGPGAILEDGAFTFVLYDEANNKLGESVNAADGSIYFPTKTYHASDVGKTYRYKIAEVKGNTYGWTYDEHIEWVTVTVTDDGSGVLTAEATYDAEAPSTFTPQVEDETDGALFVNSYEFNPPASGFGSDTTQAALLLMLFAGLLGAGYTVSHLRKRGR